MEAPCESRLLGIQLGGRGVSLWALDPGNVSVLQKKACFRVNSCFCLSASLTIVGIYGPCLVCHAFRIRLRSSNFDLPLEALLSLSYLGPSHPFEFGTRSFYQIFHGLGPVAPLQPPLLHRGAAACPDAAQPHMLYLFANADLGWEV